MLSAVACRVIVRMSSVLCLIKLPTYLDEMHLNNTHAGEGPAAGSNNNILCAFYYCIEVIN